MNPEFMLKQCEENIDRVSGLSVEDFIENYEKVNKPVIITDKMDDWPAMEKWQVETLLKRFGNTRVCFVFIVTIV